MFKANKNKGWTPDKNHHTTDTFVEAVKKDIECPIECSTECTTLNVLY